MNRRFVELAQGRAAHASGALWLEDAQAAVLADVHLGYGWALRRRGQLGPVADSATQAKLIETIDELRPRTVVLLGDVVHAPRPAPAERESVEEAVRWLASRAHVVIVLGNHDRGLVRDYPHLPAEICREWQGGGVFAVHGDQELPSAEHVIAGHLHPAFGVFDGAGAYHRMPVFVSGEHITLLPAFSPLAAGFDIRGGLPFDMGDPCLVIASGKRAVPLGRLSRATRT
ncbi:MAG TPA: metallophosphoesterase [Bryobacteraceae bacterium]|nr:metallophosphoesterase [Bryobacteraceae bacterium]